jgi:hypothetical protein
MLTLQMLNKTCLIDAKENLEQILIFNATGEKAIVLHIRNQINK